MSKLFETLMRCLQNQTTMLCASEEISDQVYLVLLIFLGLVIDKC